MVVVIVMCLYCRGSKDQLDGWCDSGDRGGRTGCAGSGAAGGVRRVQVAPPQTSAQGGGVAGLVYCCW